MRYLYTRFKDILNRMISFEIRSGNYFELGEFIDLLVNQIPYIRLKNIVEGIRKWTFNSLKLANERITIGIMKLQYYKKIDLLTDKSKDESCDKAFLYPINIICQLVDFLYLYQNKQKVFKTKLKVSLERDVRYSTCKLYTNISSSEHSFSSGGDRQIWSMIHQFTSAKNLHSPFVEIERLNENGKCLILVRFDLFKYYEEEKRVLETCRKRIGLEYFTEFKKNRNHVIYGSSEDNFIKIVDSRILADKKNSLYLESIFLDRLKDLDGFPTVRQYLRIDSYEILVTNNIVGKTFSECLSGTNGEIDTHLVFKLFDQIRKLRENFIIHRDLKDSNIMISDLEEVSITDFDQAVLSTDLSNKADLKKKNYFSLVCPCHTLHNLLSTRPQIINKINTIQEELKKVWQEAAKTNSNSPGVEIAYYSYDFGEVNYFGERDFFARWLLLEKNHISLKDKIVVELGCNLGLFGAYSALYGAKSVTCFDMDLDIIKCAKRLSDIMELRNIKHEVRDLNVKGAFKDIKKIDLMFAMSVYFWLKDTTEFDRLMRLAREVFYEGHEQYDVEYNRLKAWGFIDIKPIGTSDRLRAIFYAAK